MEKVLRFRWIVTALFLLIFLCTVKTAEYSIQAADEGAYTLSVSCTVDIGYEESEGIFERIGGSGGTSETEEMGEPESDVHTGVNGWKVDPVFALCGIGLILGAALVLIGCIRPGRF